MSGTSRRRAFVLDAAPDADARARLAAALARKDRAGLRAAARALPAAIAPLAEALATLWGPADADARARGARCRGPRAVQRRARRSCARCSRRSPSSPIRRRRRVTIDLGDLRGFDYYTGVRFAGYAGGAPDAVLRGGRYDELLGRYGRAAHATGFAIDLEAVAQAQRIDRDRAAARRRSASRCTGRGAAQLARALRARGLRAVTAARAADARAGCAAPGSTPRDRRSTPADARRAIVRGRDSAPRSGDTRAVALLRRNRCRS